MGDAFGLESALWFAKNTEDAHEEPTLNAQDPMNMLLPKLKSYEMQWVQLK